ncbi:MAG: hypothetical protein IJF92_02890 [Bacilli bacterium]|nr:hypothetical protein [Bacilli bacterium]
MNNKDLITGISKDMNMSLPTTNNYIDSSHILNYNIDEEGNLDLSASFKKYGDRVYNVWFNNDNFRFYGMKDFTIYDIYINNDAFMISISKDENGESCIKKIKFLEKDNNSLLAIENISLDDYEDNDYLEIEKKDDILKLKADNKVTVASSNDKKLKSILRTALEIEEFNIKDSFDLINSSIPNFFDQIKYNFNILENFNNLYDNDQLYAENIMNDIMLEQKQYKK